MVDGGLIVSWLVAALGKSVADKVVGNLLERLTDRVRLKVGTEPLDYLQAQPDNPAVQAWLRREIEQTARHDPRFAKELTQLQYALDRRVTEIHGSITTGPGGRVFIGDRNVGGDYVDAPPPWDMSRTPFVAKLLMALGGIASMVGFLAILVGVFEMFDAVQSGASPEEISFPPQIKQGFLIFAGSMVALAVGGLIASFSRRR